MAKVFHIGDVLTVTTGNLLSPRGMTGVYDVLNHMTGDDIYTHQIPRALKVCGPALLRQHPQLADVDASGLDESNIHGWLAKQAERFGQELPVEPLGPNEWTHVDPVLSAEAIMGEGKVIKVEP